MIKRPWYEELFDNSAKAYDREPFVRGTLGEVDFIEKEIGRDKSVRILDIGCGTGRHAIELAQRGYSVVGVDLSASQLEAAREKAAAAGVTVDLVEGDARFLGFDSEFDLVLSICEGAFALMERDEDDFAILKSASRALRQGGKLIMTTLNALYTLAHPPGEGREFDIVTFRETYEMEGADDDGELKKLTCNERHYAPSEVDWRLKSLGFEKVEIFGCELGAFSRDHRLTSESFEMLVVAEKQGMWIERRIWDIQLMV